MLTMAVANRLLLLLLMSLLSPSSSFFSPILRRQIHHHSLAASSSFSTATTSSSASTAANNTPSPASTFNQKKSTQIVLLQHHSEQTKKTATGWLLNDTLYMERFGPAKTMSNNTANSSNDDLESSLNNNDLNRSTNDDDMSLLVEDHMKLSIWTWRGTNDVTMIEEQIGRLVYNENRIVYLLWTGGATTDASAATTTTTDEITIIEETNNKSNNNEKQSAETFIIIDGTWQQAKKIYRKVPKLWSLPRISFSGDVPPSTYVLRGDYSGWRERFGGMATKNNEGDDGGGDGGDGREYLLCTAEVAAAIMDRCEKGDCADVIRSRLDVFQSTFSHNKMSDSRVGDEMN